MLNRILLIFVCSLLLVSCKLSFTKQDYQPLTSFEKLNGTYVNTDGKLSSVLGGLPENIDLVNLKLQSPKEIRISYLTDTGYVSFSKKGKIKNNYFEFYLEKKRLITILFNQIIDDKVRIGFDVQNSLFMHRTTYTYGSILIALGDQNKSEYVYIQNKSEFFPFIENDKWGYKNSSDSILIKPRYDYARLFQKNLARVKQGDKWALINRKGELLTPFKYDKIERFRDGETITKVYFENEVRYINRQGHELGKPFMKKDELVQPN